VYSDADADAAHVRLADAAVRLGPPPPAESYLRIDTVVRAAVETGSDAIHPGYGFLAERAAFARAVEDAGIVFVGPASGTIEALGDKLNARRLARGSGSRPCPPLCPAPVDRPDQLARSRQRRTASASRAVNAAGGGAAGCAGGARRGPRRPLSQALARRRRRSVTVRLPRARDPARTPHRGAVWATRSATVVALGERYDPCSASPEAVEEAPPRASRGTSGRLHALAVPQGGGGPARRATCEFLTTRTATSGSSSQHAAPGGARRDDSSRARHIVREQRASRRSKPVA